MDKPQKKYDFAISTMFTTGFNFAGSEEIVEAAKEFGKVEAMSTGEVTLFVNPLYDMNEVIDYLKSLAKNPKQ